MDGEAVGVEDLVFEVGDGVGGEDAQFEGGLLVAWVD